MSSQKATGKVFDSALEPRPTPGVPSRKTNPANADRGRHVVQKAPEKFQLRKQLTESEAAVVQQKQGSGLPNVRRDSCLDTDPFVAEIHEQCRERYIKQLTAPASFKP
eukprot:Selendium_serpulae@DN2485_c0_g1_i2.p2